MPTVVLHYLPELCTSGKESFAPANGAEPDNDEGAGNLMSGWLSLTLLASNTVV